MDDDLLIRFCTPPVFPLTGYDERVLSEAGKVRIPFEGTRLVVYRWGEGKTILLAHGWGSRASHLVLIGRSLSKDGFSVMATDMPAHSSTGSPQKGTSNMFEYCRALSTVVKSVGPVHAIIGHSLGAMCGAFIVAGIGAFADLRVATPALVLISTPPAVASVLESFCVRDGTGACGFSELKETLEKGFDFRVDDYTVGRALHDIGARTLLIHDDADEEYPVQDIIAIHEAAPETELFLTHGSGHQKILVNRTMIARVKGFLHST